MRIEPLKTEHFATISPWFEDAETQRRLGGFYPLQEQLQSLISDPDKHAWLLWQEEMPVGLIELEKEKSIAHVLILVAPDKRGQGLGHKLVTVLPPLARKMGTQTLRACVATSGVASRRCFLAAGYAEQGEEDGFVCYDLSV